MATRTLIIPDLKDSKSRVPHNARIRAYRCDTHAFVEEQIVDENGQATFTSLPTGVDIVYHTVWGGTTSTGHHRWFPIRHMKVIDGGTGGTTAEEARDNLGIDDAAILWALIL